MTNNFKTFNSIDERDDDINTCTLLRILFPHVLFFWKQWYTQRHYQGKTKVRVAGYRVMKISSCPLIQRRLNLLDQAMQIYQWSKGRARWCMHSTYLRRWIHIKKHVSLDLNWNYTCIDPGKIRLKHRIIWYEVINTNGSLSHEKGCRCENKFSYTERRIDFIYTKTSHNIARFEDKYWHSFYSVNKFHAIQEYIM